MYHGPPDVYFTRGYGLAVAEVEDGEWTCIELADGNWQMPLLVRPLASGRSDAVSPYGYAGVFAGPGLSASDIGDLWRQTLDELRGRDVVAAFVRESPLIHQAPAPTDAIRVVTGHATFHVPCRPAGEVWDAMEGRCRTSIRKADKSGTTVALAPATRDDLASGSDFRQLYEGTMDWVDARGYYFFGDSYYEALLTGLGEDLLVGTARDPDGQALAAALFMKGPRTLHYHLSGATQEGSRGGATNKMLWEAIQFAIAQGLDGVLLGGGVSDGDGLERFKRSFGGEVRTFNAYGLIIDSQAYDDELALTAARLGTEPAVLATPGFFPAYRRTQVPTPEAQ
jgi:hypothetical protein